MATDGLGNHDDENDITVHERDHLLKLTNRERQKKRVMVEKDRMKLAPSRRTGKLTRNPFICIEGGDGNSLCFRIPDGRMAGALPPDYRTSSSICKLIEEKQTKLWHTSYYDSDQKLKQLYIKICKNLPAYNSKVYLVKELRRGNTNKKVACLLGISNEKILLLDSKTKLLLQSREIHELHEWSTGTGRNQDGLLLEFRGSKPWVLAAPSSDKLKSITGALLDVMGKENRLFDNLLFCTSSHDSHNRQLHQYGPQTKTDIYAQELADLQRLLHFPEEVALKLTQTEYRLFNSVPPMYYVRQVTMELSKTPTSLPEDSQQPNIHTLIQRFYEVSSWVTHLIITQPSHEDRKSVLSCILRLLNCCWNYGNFNAAVEILVGLKSEKLKPFWLSIEDEDLSQIDTLSRALLSREPTEEYRQAVRRALSLPGCHVVPFFGSFLRDLQMILVGVPSIVVLPSDEQSPFIKSVSEYKGEDRFLTRIGVGGLINMEKVSQAHLVLTDIHLFHRHSQQMMKQTTAQPKTNQTRHPLITQQDSKDKTCKPLKHPQVNIQANTTDEADSSKHIQLSVDSEVGDNDSLDKEGSGLYMIVPLENTTSTQNNSLDEGLKKENLLQSKESVSKKDSGSDFDASLTSDCDIYEPITPIGNEHGVMLIPPGVVRPNLHDLQVLHHGVTAVHWDSKDAHSVLVYVKLENDNATLSWSKPDWSALRGSSIGLPVDYIFQGEEDRRISTPLISRYITGITLCEDMEEGQLDLLQVKSITSGQTSGDTALIFRRHGLEDAHSSCVTFLVGSSIAENKVIEFVLPKMAAEIWSRCLKRLVRFSRHLRHREIDRRVQWLKDQYLQLYLEGEACLAPTPAEAIRVFGGRKWTTESMSPGSGSDMLNTFKRNTSQASNVSSATKVNKKKLLPLSSFRDTISGTESSDREDLSTSKSSKSTRSSGTSKSSTRSSAMSSRSSTKEVTVIHKNNNKYTLTSIFHPQNLTFAFQRQTSVTSESRRFSLRSQLMESSKPITHSTQLSFGDFVELFKSFYVLLRKDVKELFDEFAVVSPEVDMSDLQKTRPPLVSSTNTGLLTRNQGVEGGIVSADHHKLFNTLSVASIVENRVDSGQQKTLGLKELMEFLVEYQEENPSREEVLALIAKHEHDSALRSTCQMSYEGFCRYLLDEDNFAFIPEIVSQDDHDLDEPLSHYYIESSHNTYLTGHQLKGESSVELYTQVLLTGCRCVELDCWDGDDGFPIIYHGHTLTTKIPFKATLIAINKYAFVASPYPVILSLENHCSVPQQQRMAQMFLEIFGDKLVTEFLFDSDFGEDPDLPSPRNLRYRILVKNKKQRNPQTPASTKQKFAPGRTFTLDSTINDDEEEDEEEEEEDFLADSEVKDESSIQSRPLLSLEKSQSVEQEQSCSLLTQISDLSSMPRDVVASTSSLHTAPRKRSPSTSPTHTRAKSMGQLPLKTASDTTSMTTVPSTPATPLDRRHNSMDNLLDDVGNRKSQGLIQFSSSTDLTEPGTGVFFSGNKAMYKRATRTSSDDTNSHHSHGHSTASPRVSTSSSGKGWFGTLLRSNKPKEVSYSEGEENTGKKKVRHTGSDSPKGSCGREKDRHSLDKDQSRAGSTDEKGKEFDGKLRPRSEPTGLGWQGDDRDVEPTPKPFKKKKVAIAQELSDIIIYTQAVKFKGLITTSSAAAKQKKLTNKKSMIPGSVSAVTGSTPSPTDKPEFYLPSNSTMSNVRKFDDDYAPSCHQMSSLNENKAKQECRKHPTAVICHTERHLMRTYPAGTRIDSSNFNPLFFWAFGIQFAALNYQTDDQATQVNAAMFEQWGRSGYMLKPRVMWDRSHPLFGRFNPHEKEFEGHKPITLKIHLISGQYLCPSHRQGSPYVEVEILGIPADCAKHKSKVSSRNPINPIWNELCTFQIYFPDLAFVRFVVMDTTSGHVTAQRIIPLTCLRPGYRHVRLRNQKNVPLELSTLFIYSRREDEHTSNILSSHDPLHDDMASQSKQGAMLSKIGLTDINKLEKEKKSTFVSKLRKSKQQGSRKVDLEGAGRRHSAYNFLSSAAISPPGEYGYLHQLPPSGSKKRNKQKKKTKKASPGHVFVLKKRPGDRLLERKFSDSALLDSEENSELNDDSFSGRFAVTRSDDEGQGHYRKNSGLSTSSMNPEDEQGDFTPQNSIEQSPDLQVMQFMRNKPSDRYIREDSTTSSVFTNSSLERDQDMKAMDILAEVCDRAQAEMDAFDTQTVDMDFTEESDGAEDYSELRHCDSRNSLVNTTDDSADDEMRSAIYYVNRLPANEHTNEDIVSGIDTNANEYYSNEYSQSDNSLDELDTDDDVLNGNNFDFNGQGRSEYNIYGYNDDTENNWYGTESQVNHQENVPVSGGTNQQVYLEESHIFPSFEETKRSTLAVKLKIDGVTSDESTDTCNDKIDNEVKYKTIIEVTAESGTRNKTDLEDMETPGTRNSPLDTCNEINHEDHVEREVSCLGNRNTDAETRDANLIELPKIVQTEDMNVCTTDNRMNDVRNYSIDKSSSKSGHQIESSVNNNDIVHTAVSETSCNSATMDILSSSTRKSELSEHISSCDTFSASSVDHLMDSHRKHTDQNKDISKISSDPHVFKDNSNLSFNKLNKNADKIQKLNLQLIGNMDNSETKENVPEKKGSLRKKSQPGSPLKGNFAFALPHRGNPRISEVSSTCRNVSLKRLKRVFESDKVTVPLVVDTGKTIDNSRSVRKRFLELMLCSNDEATNTDYHPSENRLSGDSFQSKVSIGELNNKQSNDKSPDSLHCESQLESPGQSPRRTDTDRPRIVKLVRRRSSGGRSKQRPSWIVKRKGYFESLQKVSPMTSPSDKTAFSFETEENGNVETFCSSLTKSNNLPQDNVHNCLSQMDISESRNPANLTNMDSEIYVTKL